MRPDVRRMLLLQAGNALLMAAGLAVMAVAVDTLTALYAASPSNLGMGGVGGVFALGGGFAVVVLGILAYRWTARGERYAPLFAVLGWAMLWLPFSLTLGVAAGGHPALGYIATLVCGAGIVLSLAALASKKPR